MLFKRKKKQPKTWNRDQKEPVIKASICNGEQVAGFKDSVTGKFEEITLIRTPADLDAFREEYGIEGEIRKEY